MGFFSNLMHRLTPAPASPWPEVPAHANCWTTGGKLDLSRTTRGWRIAHGYQPYPRAGYKPPDWPPYRGDAVLRATTVKHGLPTVRRRRAGK